MQTIGRVSIVTLIMLMIMSCLSCLKEEKVYMKLGKKAFGKTAEGKEVWLYSLQNKKGMEVKIMTYGGTVISLRIPDRHGQFADVVLGYDNLDGYLKNNPYFGGIIGRFGNRIAKGRFSLNRVAYQLSVNSGENHLHGGFKGFDKVVWNSEELESDTTVGVKLKYFSPDGEEGYPGNLEVTVTYLLNNANELQIEYQATTDKPTIVNMTHHSYFNLAGAGAGDILNQQIMINADRFTPVDKNLIPSGELKDVTGTPMDFRKPTAIGARINETDEQLAFAGGYDHNWVLNKNDKPLTLAATAYDSSSGRMLEIYTTEPGLQFYSGNFLDGSITGKQDKVYKHRFGFCLEPQHFPDSPNKPNFPAVDLKPGEKYYQKTVYKFLTS
jgi:aldose 1-epimerase